MKISEELSDSYLYCLASSNGNIKTVCDALQQAVAEELKANEWLRWVAGGQHGPSPSLFLDEYLAEADKLLRGEK